MNRILDIHMRLADGHICPTDTEYLLQEYNHLVAEREHQRVRADDYKAALTRTLRWARSNRFSVWSANPDIQRWDIEGDGAELFSALADAGFEIDADDHLVIHGERVRE